MESDKDNRVTAERKPDGGIIVSGRGIELSIPSDELQTADEKGGVGFAYVASPELVENLPPMTVETGDAPHSETLAIHVSIEPLDRDD